MLAYDDGYNYSEIAKIFLLDDETIRRHLENYLSKKKLTPENGGSQSYLSEADSKALKAHLQTVTYLYVKDICAYVRVTFKKSYTVSGMTKCLHANNFRYKKPHAVPAKASRERQEKFMDYYARLKKKAGCKEPIYFADSVHPQPQTRLAYAWILKGERKAIAMTGRQKRLSFMGGIVLDGHKIIYKQSEKVNAQSIMTFLDEVRKKHPDNCRVHVIWDNAGYHQSHEVKAYAKKLRIKIHYLPPYSPNLNPIERLWKIMHETVTYNQYYEKFSDFSEATLNFFKAIRRSKKLLRPRITDNFQILHSPLLAS